MIEESACLKVKVKYIEILRESKLSQRKRLTQTARVTAGKLS